MALIKCPECDQQVSELALSCPHCGAPPAAHKASTTIATTHSSEHMPSAFGSVSESLTAHAAAVRSVKLRPGDVALLAGVACIVGGLFLPLIKRPAVGSLLSFYEHSQSSSATLVALSLLAAGGYLFRRWWVTAAAGITVAVVSAVVLSRLHDAFDQLVHPAMQLRAGTYLIFAGAALIIVASGFRKSAQASPGTHESVVAAGHTKQSTQAEAKALFAAWLKQQGLPADMTLAERQSRYEVFLRLYQQGQLDMIGLRHILGEQKK